MSKGGGGRKMKGLKTEVKDAMRATTAWREKDMKRKKTREKEAATMAGLGHNIPLVVLSATPN